jgi:hypothetical protein
MDSTDPNVRPSASSAVETGNPDTLQDTFPCKYCRKLIPKGAVYCAECEQFQTLGYRILKKLDLSSIVAALPIVAICAVFIYEKIVFPYSNLAISILQCRLDAVDLAVSNSGTRPGIISGGALEQEISTHAASSYRLLPKDGLTLLNPNSSIIMTLTVHKNDISQSKDLIPPAPLDSKCIYRMSIDVVDFGSNKPAAKLRDCKCPGSI